MIFWFDGAVNKLNMNFLLMDLTCSCALNIQSKCSLYFFRLIIKLLYKFTIFIFKDSLPYGHVLPRARQDSGVHPVPVET